MNLALHGFLLHVILSIFNFKHGFRLCSAGEPGYLDFDNLPETNFSCQGKVIGGYYADVEAGCQMFHVCTIGQKDEIMDIKFLCLNGTVFDQETRVCERVDEVDCSKSERFYNLNLELYGNNAVTLSLHEEEEDDGPTDSREDHQQKQQQQQQQQLMTSARPSTTTTTTTTTARPSQPTTTSAYQQHQTGYPQHFQPRPAFPSAQSQSNTHYDDKNGGYHHQYIFHNDERSNNNQATSYQLFSNQGVSSTTPTAPQVHQQVRYGSTSNPQVIHNEPSTVTPLQFHVQSTSSTIQTLLNNNANINPLYHNHGIASTTEQFNTHNNNPREIPEYEDDSEENDEQEDRRPLEPLQSTNKGKVSKLTISPNPRDDHSPAQVKTNHNPQQQRLSINYLPTPTPIQTTIRASFYPSQSPTSQKSLKPQSNQQSTQHIHVPASPAISQLKSHQITINLQSPDIQRIVQNPSPLLPSQSRVIVTAKASVSDESGRPLNTSQLITIPLPTIPSNYDDYKEGDESFDPFYRDVPKIRNDRRILFRRKIQANERVERKKRSADFVENDKSDSSGEIIFNAEIKDLKDLKENLPIIKAILFGLPLPESKEPFNNSEINNSNETFLTTEPPTKFRKVTDKLKETVNNMTTPRAKILASSVTEKKLVRPEISKFTPNRRRFLSRSKNSNLRIHDEEHKKSPSTLQPQITSSPVIVEPKVIEVVPKDTVQLFLRTVDGNSSFTDTSNSQQKSKNVSNDTTIDKKKIDEHKSESFQTRPLSNLNKSNRRRNQYRESEEELKEFPPHKNYRISRPRPYRYYDEYDVSESIEVSSRQRSNRLRPRLKDRRVTNYRNIYLDEEVEDEYDEKNFYRNRNSTPRRTSQDRRVSYRNRNQQFDYDDDVVDADVEMNPKQDSRAKNTNVSSRSRARSYYERYPDENEHRVEVSRRKNRRRRPSSAIIRNLSLNDTELVDDENFKEEYHKPIQIVDTGMRVKNNRPSFDRNDQSKRQNVVMRKRLNNLDLNHESEKKQADLTVDDYFDQRKSIPDDYNDPEERRYTSDYVDYEDIEYRTSRPRISNRRNKNRFESAYEINPRRKATRRNKSRNFSNETPENVQEEIKTVAYDVESTTGLDDQDYETTTSVLEYTVPYELTTSQDYDDSLIKTTLTIETDEETLSPLKGIVTTEGVYKFTDELPSTENKNNDQENKNQRDSVILDEEDYIDDNYERESYGALEDKDVSSAISKDENNQTSDNLEAQTEATKYFNQSVRDSNTSLKNKKSDENSYEDKSGKTTVSEEYDDLEFTTEIPTTTLTTPASSSVVSEQTSKQNVIPITTPKYSTFTTSSTTTPSSTTTTFTFGVTENISSTTVSVKTPNTIVANSNINKSSFIPSNLNATTMSSTVIPTTTLRSRNFSTTARSKNKFFKPLAFRKNYFHTTSTTPNTVNIRRGQPLTGPKPSKPPSSYNELALKPVIRRLPLLSRTTTSASVIEEKVKKETSTPVAKPTYKNTQENNYSIYNSPNAPTLKKLVTNMTSNFATTTEINNKEKPSEEITSTPVAPVNRLNFKNKTTEQISQIAKHNLENEVPKKNHSQQISDSSEAETETPELEFTTYTDSSDSEITTKRVDEDFYVEATTLRNFRPDRQKLELTGVNSQTQKINLGPKQIPGFNCLDKEMYRFYGDARDCRLFHYCSPGFTARQVLDFRFVCEEGTIFDEKSQSCKDNVPNPKCIRRNL